jgi:uncharacterized protein (TIGR03118 family)
LDLARPQIWRGDRGVLKRKVCAMASGKPARVLVPALVAIGIASIALLVLPALSGRPVTNAFTNILPNANHYEQTNLLSNLTGKAAFRDPDLKNAWGMAFFPGGPFWISDNNSGFSTVCEANGQLDFVVQIPLPPGSKASFAAPTGIVANSTSDFSIGATGPAFFIFSSEDGTITAWNGGSAAALVANEVPAGAIYKGLAMATNGGANFLYATDFHNARIQVFDKNFHPTTLSGTFSDPSIPAGLRPVRNRQYRRSALCDLRLTGLAKGQRSGRTGQRLRQVFDTAGHLIPTKPTISHGALNSPWGVAIAPTNFGAFSNDLLVGNLGDGTIHAYNPTSGITGRTRRFGRPTDSHRGTLEFGFRGRLDWQHQYPVLQRGHRWTDRRTLRQPGSRPCTNSDADQEADSDADQEANSNPNQEANSNYDQEANPDSDQEADFNCNEETHPYSDQEGDDTDAHQEAGHRDSNSETNSNLNQEADFDCNKETYPDSDQEGDCADPHQEAGHRDSNSETDSNLNQEADSDCNEETYPNSDQKADANSNQEGSHCYADTLPVPVGALTA